MRVTTGGRRSDFDALLLPLLHRWGTPVARAGDGGAEWQVLASQRGAVAVSEEAPAPAEGVEEDDEQEEEEEVEAGAAEALAERRTEAGAGEELEEEGEEEEAGQEGAEPEQAQAAGGGSGGSGGGPGSAGGRGSRALVYASSRRLVEQLHAYIEAVSDARVAFYHAGMSSAARRAVELRWRTGELAAVVATVRWRSASVRTHAERYLL